MRPQEEANAIVRHLRALTALKERYEQRSGETIGTEFDVFANLAKRIEAEFPGALPPFDEDVFRGRWPAEFRQYNLALVRAWLAAAVAAIEGQLTQTSTFEKQEFLFVEDERLRPLLVRDFAEIGRAAAAGCWKSVIILCGGAVEGMLTDALTRHLSKGSLATGTPKGEPKDWKFYHKIEAATACGILSAAVGKLSHSLREYRNLVHPAIEVESKVKVPIDREEAMIAVEVLKIVCRDLSAVNSAPQTR